MPILAFLSLVAFIVGEVVTVVSNHSPFFGVWSMLFVGLILFVASTLVTPVVGYVGRRNSV
jgi:hypothetical protein